MVSPCDQFLYLFLGEILTLSDFIIQRRIKTTNFGQFKTINTSSEVLTVTHF